MCETTDEVSDHPDRKKAGTCNWPLSRPEGALGVFPQSETNGKTSRLVFRRAKPDMGVFEGRSPFNKGKTENRQPKLSIFEYTLRGSNPGPAD